jgi:hypothetical protein
MTAKPDSKFIYFLEFQVTTCLHVAVNADTSHEAFAAAQAAGNPSSAAFISDQAVAHDWVINDRQPL